jgi:hypothetical protein
VFTVQKSVGAVFIMDLHVVGNHAPDVQGYLVKGGADANSQLVTLKNSRAIGFDYGYEIRDDNVVITGSPEIKNGKIGVWVNGGSYVKIESNNEVWNNSLYGIRLYGNNNTVKSTDVGTSGHANGTGISVVGYGNTLDGNSVYGNTGDGINVSGGTVAKPNILVNNKSGEKGKGNGGNGILLAGLGNGGSNPVEVESNTTRANGNDGIKVTGTGHQLKNNTSGGDATQNNVHCEFNVVASNVNSGGNKANNVTVSTLSLCNGSAVNIGGRDIVGNILPSKTMLVNVFPNPFNGTTNIRYDLAKAGYVSLSIVDNYGRELTKLVNAQQPAGSYNIQWNAKSYASGSYFVHLTTGQYKGVNKLFIVW